MKAKEADRRHGWKAEHSRNMKTTDKGSEMICWELCGPGSPGNHQNTTRGLRYETSWTQPNISLLCVMWVIRDRAKTCFKFQASDEQV